MNAVVQLRDDAGRTERAVEIILDRGGDHRPGVPRYGAGSGLLVGGARVLTAAHTVDEGVISVRTTDRREFRAVRLDLPPVDDLALLEIVDPAFLPGPPPLPLGDVDRTSDAAVEGCTAVGYPKFCERRDGDAQPRRDTAHLRGVIPPRSRLVGGRLEFEVTATPRPLPEAARGVSEWSGISGSAVCAMHPDLGSVLVGVIVDHHRPSGSSSLLVVPISRALEHEGWGVRLGFDAKRGPVRLPAVREIRPSPYRATVRELTQRTGRLIGRQYELSCLAHFARGGTPAGYLWIMGEKWWGKTSLLADFADRPPADVDVVAYFITPRGDATSERFARVANDQLARLLGHEPTAETGDLDGFRTQWARAAQRAALRRRPMVLVVDGLDDDTSVARGMASIASVLPRETSPWARVVVTSRGNPSLPADVDPAHPLYDAAPFVIAAPDVQVQWRNRMVEARHGLCPRCKLKDAAEPVTALVGKGQPVPGSLAATLRPPPPIGPGGWAPLRVLAAFVVVGALLALLADGEPAAFVVYLAGVAGVVWSTVVIRRRARRAALARQIWPLLRYCHRDEIVFEPQAGASAYGGNLPYLLGQLVGVAERARKA